MVVICTHQSVLPYNDACITSLPLIIHFSVTPNQLVLGRSTKEPCSAPCFGIAGADCDLGEIILFVINLPSYHHNSDLYF